MDITEDHRNAYGGLMGGVIFTFGDFAFAVASNQMNLVRMLLCILVQDINYSCLYKYAGYFPAYFVCTKIM